MSFETPESLQYLETHEWARIDEGTARIGITDFAQDELGDVVFVELPEIGSTFEQNEQFGVIESIKALSELYVPVAGTVTAVNDTLESKPELVNTDPYGDGWMIELDVGEASTDERVLSAEEYADRTY
ncbi:glycine cleavage system protein GcvH [Halobellus litoreus]|uniref:Probable glycine cleavage system H protein n=1 Tax=Halobellus litoreus TaxID=755310 RepID=A0ABD6DTJ8_9EURY|nr:glycine cleavage system protein GcvH [Halobellus litoreus]